MSPFSHFLHELRMRHGVRQNELAERIGYEQSYISALEAGTKGPPTQDFLDRFQDVLSLSDEDARKLSAAAPASQRRRVIDADLPQDVFWLVNRLWSNLPLLTPTQVRVIKLYYNGDALQPILKRYGEGVEVRVVFDPDDLGEVQVWGPDDPEPRCDSRHSSATGGRQYMRLAESGACAFSAGAWQPGHDVAVFSDHTATVRSSFRRNCTGRHTLRAGFAVTLCATKPLTWRDRVADAPLTQGS